MKYFIQSLAVFGLILDVLGFLYLCKGNWQQAFGTSIGSLLEKIPIFGRNENEKHWYASPTVFGIILALCGFLFLLLATILGFFVIE